MHLMDNLFRWLIDEAVQLVDLLSTAALSALSPDLALFVSVFPIVAATYDIFRITALTLLSIGLVWGLFKNFALPIGIEADPPFQLVAKTLLFMFLAFFALDIVTIALNIAGTPYEMIISINASAYEPDWVRTHGLITIVALTAGKALLTSAILGLVFVLIIGWNYIKLILECVERYIMVGILAFTSPLAFAMGPFSSTNLVFKSWCKMLGGQILLLLMNIWILRIFVSMLNAFMANPSMRFDSNGSVNFSGGDMGVIDIMSPDGGINWDVLNEQVAQSTSDLGPLTGLVLWMFFIIAFLKAAQKLAGLVNQLGLNVTQAGGGSVMAGMMAGKAIGMGIAAAGKGISARFGGSGGSSVGAGMSAGTSGSGGAMFIPAGGASGMHGTPGTAIGTTGSSSGIDGSGSKLSGMLKPPAGGREYNTLGKILNSKAVAGAARIGGIALKGGAVGLGISAIRAGAPYIGNKISQGANKLGEAITTQAVKEAPKYPDKTLADHGIRIGSMTSSHGSDSVARSADISTSSASNGEFIEASSYDPSIGTIPEMSADAGWVDANNYDSNAIYTGGRADTSMSAEIGDGSFNSEGSSHYGRDSVGTISTHSDSGIIETSTTIGSDSAVPTGIGSSSENGIDSSSGSGSVSGDTVVAHSKSANNTNAIVNAGQTTNVSQSATVKNEGVNSSSESGSSIGKTEGTVSSTSPSAPKTQATVGDTKAHTNIGSSPHQIQGVGSATDGRSSTNDAVKATSIAPQTPSSSAPMTMGTTSHEQSAPISGTEMRISQSHASTEIVKAQTVSHSESQMHSTKEVSGITEMARGTISPAGDGVTRGVPRTEGATPINPPSRPTKGKHRKR